MKLCQVCYGKPCTLMGQPMGPFISGSHIVPKSLVPGKLDFFQEQDYLRKLISLILFIKNPQSRFMLSNSELVRLKYKNKDKLKEEEKRQNQERLKK